MDPRTICEVSRLAVPSIFRRRSNESESPLGAIQGIPVTPDEERVFPMISAGLFLTALALADHLQRPQLFAIMEPKLARFLTRIGLYVVQIGYVGEYHGTRAPFHLRHDEAMRHLQPSLQPLYASTSELIRDHAHHVLDNASPAAT